MTLAQLVIGSPEWWPVAVMLFAACAGYAVRVTLRTAEVGPTRIVALGLKITGVMLLAACLVNPLWSGQRARPGENELLVLVDDSHSLGIRDANATVSRAERLNEELESGRDTWQRRLERDFEVRGHTFDERQPDLAGVDAVESNSSPIAKTIAQLASRGRDRAVAGVLVFTDGIDTQPLPLDSAKTPPVFPVIVGTDETLPDLAITEVAVTESAFEDAPIAVRLDASVTGFAAGETIVARLTDADGETLEERSTQLDAGRSRLAFRFQVRKAMRGVSFLRVRIGSGDERDAMSRANFEGEREATYANNERRVALRRPHEPRRVLWVSGRPSWEFKFVSRAASDEDQLRLVGLIRAAKREAKFDWRGRVGETTNSIFRGLGEQADVDAESYDEAVTIRLNVTGPDELAGGKFPATADALFAYDAVVLDDLEAAFFSRDQLELLSRFVSVRGGGLLMLGGAESLAEGGYRHTPVEELLPTRIDGVPGEPRGPVRLHLTRDGWLQPWLRLRETRTAETERLEAMPAFRVTNGVGRLRPGATVLAELRDESGTTHPALVTHRFGRGRSAVSTIGDSWRWHLRREPGTEDHHKAWRQMLRWLVTDVPERVACEIVPRSDGADGAATVRVRARDAAFEPIDNAAATVTLTAPDGEEIRLHAEPSVTEAGLFTAEFVASDAGGYRVAATVVDGEGTAVGEAVAGWVHQPDVAEFARITPDRERLEAMAAATGGRVLEFDDLDAFARDLAFEPVPVTETWTYPLWHQSWVFLLAIGCFAGEWGLRRWRGLP